MTDSTVAEPLGPGDPQEIGSFTIIGLLGTGGMGEVYLGASDRGYAAVKRVRPRLVSSERFEREVGILYRVPFGVGPRVLASDGTAERPWFAAEYVPGLTVDEAVRLRGPLPAEALWLLLAEAATQLRAVHASEIAHRDIKPGNVMLVRDGVKLIDFGIARAADQARLTRGGGSYGTQGFSAPEQQAGNEDVAAPADVYSLAALLLYASSGRTPGVVPDLAPLRTVDADLAAVIEPCLATDPQRRPTAHEIAAAARLHLPVPPSSWPPEVMSRIDARRAFAATPVGKLETVPPPDLATDPNPEVGATPLGSPRRPRTRLLVLPIAAVIALGAVAAFVLSPSGSPHDRPSPSAGSTSVTVESTVGTTQRPSASPSASPTTPAPTGSTQPLPPSPTASPSATSKPTPPTTPPSTAPAPVVTASSPATAPSVTSSSISGINGGDDPAQVKGSEADTSWFGNVAACSAWLDDNGSGALAGVLNTSLNQTCVAELNRSDGLSYTFRASWGAAKTNFVPDTGTTMWICVWNASDRTSEQCSARFGMNGTTPVRR
ncbi:MULTISPECIES: serine/threonine-protein kinase [unclassified Kitasatospora]|uniref:serine/threonine-protein kinase n=1 Tax=unclassified Kitasatospora TaxID=2633591 RepID=UPI00070D197D|nr:MULTISPECIES: serine/threonine-protein kinase [unclassified Kitasatospora]KQV22895.1 serine/threonine protein kinase [Kitasatospora sp. Root107]KRB61755.1 serine/threonine protein kinase [Kitasatospora sp. Root187]